MDLKNDDIKRLYSRFLNEKKQALGLTDEKLASKLDLSDRTVARYMAMHQEGNWLPNVISDVNYRDFLTAVGASHDEFADYVARATVPQQNTNQDSNHTQAPSQSTGNGAAHIGSVTISGSAVVNQSPINAQTVSYGATHHYGPERQ